MFHGQTSFETCSFMLAPVKAETGMKVTSFGLKMPFLRKVEIWDLMKSKLVDGGGDSELNPEGDGETREPVSAHRSLSQFTVGSSILLMTMMSLVTPAVLTSWACSRVWPPLSNPASNSPLRAEMT